MNQAMHESEIELVDLMLERYAHDKAIEQVEEDFKAYKALIDALAKEVA